MLYSSALDCLLFDFSPLFKLNESNVLALQIKKDQRIRLELNNSQKDYLKFHREQLFGKLGDK